MAQRLTCLFTLVLVLVGVPGPTRALPPETTASVVSVLPVWPGRAQGGAGAPPGVAPEGSGIVVRPGVIATAWHVVEPAERIDVRLADGRILPAELISKDVATDIAVLSVGAELLPFSYAPTPALADRACAIGNAWGLGLSVTCGVVSALDVTDAGFNPIEHFVQTDTAANPGVSGGALVDANGRLLGMMSAIFASQGETNIGVNFAVSAELLERVVGALLDDGAVDYPDPGWRLSRPDRSQLKVRAVPIVSALDPNGAAALAGIQQKDLVLAVGKRRVRTPRDVTAALALLPDEVSHIDIMIEREGEVREVMLALGGVEATETTPRFQDECPYPAAVCRMRQVVFPISSFDPVGSATRIGPNLLVTNRHIVGSRRDAIVHTPKGPRNGRVLASAYAGDLVLIQVDGLPADGLVASLEGAKDIMGPTFAVGADVARQEIRVFEPGTLLALPAQGATLGRLHVTSHMQPGMSGGALVDEEGGFIGISVGGGEGRYEAIPLENVRALLQMRYDNDAEEVTERLGTAFAECTKMLDSVRPRQDGTAEFAKLSNTCAASQNQGQLLEAGRVLAMAGDFDAAIALHSQAVEQVPNSINARVSLLVSLQLAARFDEMVPQARRVLEMAPDDPQVLRFAIQSGVWGGAPELAEKGYDALLKADPRQAQAARRFIDNAPPAPVRR